MAERRQALISGKINTENIYDTHAAIKNLVEQYKEINLEVSNITATVNENWVGKGHSEFESQYKLLISKIEDFGDTLQEIYDALVDAEASYEAQDASLGNELTVAMKQ